MQGRPTGRTVALLALVLLLATAMRAAPVIRDAGSFRPRADAAEYDRHAVSLARFGHYPESAVAPGSATALRPPGYPYVLAAAYAVTATARSDDRWTVGRGLGVAIGVGVVAALGWIALLLFDGAVAVAAMTLAALYPPLVAASDALLSEALFILAVLLAVGCVLRARRDSPAYAWLVAAGALAGLACLTRGNGPVVLVALVAGAASGRPRREAAQRAAALLAAVLVVLAPWAVRNLVVFDRFVPTSTQAGFALAGTYNDVARRDRADPGAWRPVVTAPYAAVLRRTDLDEADKATRLLHLEFAYIRDHPAYPLSVIVHNVPRLFGFAGTDHERHSAPEIGISGRWSDLDVYAFWLLAGGALAGALTPRARRAPRFVWLVPLLLVASVLPVEAFARYRVPADPFLILLFAVAATARRPRLE